ncbi:MAG: YdjC-like protein [uncultured bacterium]|nr:MAG: YdjC-like protein [uncultured bacterium]
MENISYESHRKRLIISADDFGVSSRANRNILFLISLGKIDRVEVMSNGIISPNEVDELSRSGVKIDIHLDILHEFENNRKKDIGAIIRMTGFLGKLFTGEILPSRVKQQWEDQIETFRQVFGRYPDGISSHEHVHFFPPFFKLAIELQAKYDIPYIRFGDSIEITHHNFIAYTLHLLKILNLRACRKFSCVSSSSLVSLDWIKNLDIFLDKLPEGTIEIACHPELAEDFVKIKKYF